MAFDTKLVFDPDLDADWAVDGTGYPLGDLTAQKVTEALTAGAEEIRYSSPAAQRIGELMGRKMNAPV